MYIYDGRVLIICLFLAPGWGTSVSLISLVIKLLILSFLPKYKQVIKYRLRASQIRWLNCPWNFVQNNPYGPQYSLHMEVDHSLVSRKIAGFLSIQYLPFSVGEGQKPIILLFIFVEARNTFLQYILHPCSHTKYNKQLLRPTYILTMSCHFPL